MQLSVPPLGSIVNFTKMSVASGLLCVLAACGSGLNPVSASLVPSSQTITQESTLTLTAQISGDGAARVRFLEGTALIAEATQAPYTANLNLTAAANGTKLYGVDVLDAQNNVLAHSTASVVVKIPQTLAKEGTLTLTLSRKATLEPDPAGMASYYCRMAICAGDNGSNQAVRAFLEFSLADLPSSLQSADITSATLKVYQTDASKTYSKLGRLHFEHVNYGSTPLFDSPVLQDLGVSHNATEGYKEVDALAAVRNDWNNRSNRGSRSEYRLRFEKDTDNDSTSDLATFGDADPVEYGPQLVIRYKLP